ncbi:hypothetical protein H1D32_08950 [Anaerobacillus sp. CMMVII]|uniref:BsuPI-related putative proteinase inhibitor n=1 Tax=Anaerobacillus sp. CMMVII TaxID=2755588 RepID=UPI0021B7D337|nr:BsuPI-related putative proteinase inhibitor [Anaerobacillus sp. CMMVII]MCT8137869.1 hypothetical protein [Anaerobacillus sp. CMMVII]
MLKVVSIAILGLFLSTGCGTNIESIDYDSGDEAMDLKATLNIEEVGETMQFELTLTNEGDEKVLVQFPSGQQFEITVRDEDQNIVYRYSDGKMFTMAIISKEIKPKEKLVWTDTWEDAVPGTYTVTCELQIMSINGESVDRDQFTVQKSVKFEK